MNTQEVIYCYIPNYRAAFEFGYTALRSFQVFSFFFNISSQAIHACNSASLEYKLFLILV